MIALPAAPTSAGTDELSPVAVKPRNVFIVCNNIDETGGVQLVAHVLAREFAARGHNVELIGISHAEAPHPYEVEGYRAWTLYEEPVVRPWRPRRLRHLTHVHLMAREAIRRRTFARAVATLNERFRSVPDGIVICTQVFAMQWVAAADTSHLRIITQSHESFDASRGATMASRGSTRFRRMQTLYRDADAFLLLTLEDAERFERAGFDNVGVMYNPLTRSPKRQAELDSRTVINVGRYHGQKNQRALLTAWAIVAQRHPDWRLEVYGEGPLEDDLRAYATELGIDKSATICGITHNVEEKFLGSSIFALSSDFEGLPLVLVEAMAHGVPCVSVDCGPGIREIITDGEDGVVVPPNDPDALADGICRLIEDPDLRKRLGATASRSVGRFSRASVIRQWEELFDFVER